MELRDKDGMTEREFLEDYKSTKKKYPSPFLTADLVVFTHDKDKVLLIKRGGHPFLGYWACPGGFVNQNEDARTAAMRELMEETGLEISEDMIKESGMLFTELGLFSKPGRDPRGWIVSDVYVAVLPKAYPSKKDGAEIEVHGQDDADDAKWLDIVESDDGVYLSTGNETIMIGKEPQGLAFDHDDVLTRAMRLIGIDF